MIKEDSVRLTYLESVVSQIGNDGDLFPHRINFFFENWEYAVGRKSLLQLSHRFLIFHGRRADELRVQIVEFHLAEEDMAIEYVRVCVCVCACVCLCESE